MVMWHLDELTDRERDAKKARQHQELVNMAKALGASVQTVDKHALNQLSGNRPHQVALCPYTHAPLSGRRTSLTAVHLRTTTLSNFDRHQSQ
jgi:tRNA G18 (ribose-2'-O)-methylase SpoU